MTTAETILCECWSKLETAVNAELMTTDDMVRLFGRLSTRIVLFLTKKQKDGLETTTYPDLKAIKEAFTLQFNDKVKGDGCAMELQEAVVPDPKDDPAVDMDQQSDPCYLARQNGFVEGKFFLFKKEDGKKEAMLLESMDGSGVTLSYISSDVVTLYTCRRLDRNKCGCRTGFETGLQM